MNVIRRTRVAALKVGDQVVHPAFGVGELDAFSRLVGTKRAHVLCPNRVRYTCSPDDLTLHVPVSRVIRRRRIEAH